MNLSMFFRNRCLDIYQISWKIELAFGTMDVIEKMEPVVTDCLKRIRLYNFNIISTTEMFQADFPSGRKIVPALIVVDMQNGFVSKGGSYDRLGMNTLNYREIIPKLRDLIDFCTSKDIPIFYTEAVKEASGIDVLTKVHNFLPKTRQERLKIPICVRGTWDGVTIDDLKPTERSRSNQTERFSFSRYRITSVASE
jgi:hypothetical protein